MRARKWLLTSTDDPDAEPCGPDSDCINRAIFIECLAGQCRAGNHCHNQRYVSNPLLHRCLARAKSMQPNKRSSLP
jgi:hypothetical protein